MDGSFERCDVCGATAERAARNCYVGEGENTAAFHHYVIRCRRCGHAKEDMRLRNLNAAGAAAAWALAFCRPAALGGQP